MLWCWCPLNWSWKTSTKKNEIKWYVFTLGGKAVFVCDSLESYISWSLQQIDFQCRLEVDLLAIVGWCGMVKQTLGSRGRALAWGSLNKGNLVCPVWFLNKQSTSVRDDQVFETTYRTSKHTHSFSKMRSQVGFTALRSWSCVLINGYCRSCCESSSGSCSFFKMFSFFQFMKCSWLAR